MSVRKAPPNYECPYQRACPHMEGISTQWALTIFQEHWRLEDQARLLEEENDRLRAENAQVKIERDQIQARFTALHRRQFKSSKRPLKPTESEETPPPKKRGPPVGHPPWLRRIPQQIDRVVSVPAPTVCPHCACASLGVCAEKVEQIQEDIVLVPRPTVTQFQHDTAFCPKCRRPVYDTGPGELRHCSIGPVTKAVGVWLHHQLKLPFRQVREILSTLFGMSFVPASALNFSLTAAGKSQPLYEDLREKLCASTLLHLDETSWRLDGLSAWLWYAGNADLDFFHIDRSRAAKVITAILGDDFRGDVVCDGYAVYDALMARWRQTCLAHMIRTAKEIAAELRLIQNPADYQSDLEFAVAIAEFFKEVCALDRKRRQSKLPRKQARALVPRLRRRLRGLCATKLSHPKTRNLRDRLTDVKRDAKKLFTFLMRPGMPPTNNHAERALRGPVIARKISFGSRSEAGAHAFAVLASLIGTARRQNQPVLPFLYTLFTADPQTAQTALYNNSA